MLHNKQQCNIYPTKRSPISHILDLLGLEHVQMGSRCCHFTSNHVTLKPCQRDDEVVPPTVAPLKAFTRWTVKKSGHFKVASRMLKLEFPVSGRGSNVGLHNRQ